MGTKENIISRIDSRIELLKEKQPQITNQQYYIILSNVIAELNSLKKEIVAEID